MKDKMKGLSELLQKDENNNDIPDVIEDSVHERRSDRLRHFEYLERRLQEIGTHTSVALELVVALLVFIACIIGVLSLFPALVHYYQSGGTGAGLIHFLEEIFTIVVGIEFLKMLCKPTSANVLETIIFLIARHMILGEATPLEDLFYVLSIVLLVVAKRYISMTHKHKTATAEPKEKKN